MVFDTAFRKKLADAIRGLHQLGKVSCRDAFMPLYMQFAEICTIPVFRSELSIKDAFNAQTYIEGALYLAMYILEDEKDGKIKMIKNKYSTKSNITYTLWREKNGEKYTVTLRLKINSKIATHIYVINAHRVLDERTRTERRSKFLMAMNYPDSCMVRDVLADVELDLEYKY